MEFDEIPSDEVLRNLGVEDITSWKVWHTIQKHPILNEEKCFFASDGKTEINLAWLPHLLKKKIEHLTTAEQQKILDLKDKYQSQMSKESAWKRKAYGSTNASGREKYLDTKFNVLATKSTEIIELFGKYYTVDEVYEIATTKWHIPVTHQMLADFRKVNIAQIEEKKRMFNASFSDVRLGHKRSRIEELCQMYSIFKTKLVTGLTKQETTARLMKDLLKDIKDEVEGDVITINGSVDININATIEHHVKAEALKHISIRQIIIGRVAAKRNVSPELLISQLSKSYYSGYIETEEIDYQDITYPTEKAYDFNVIETQAEERKRESVVEEAKRKLKLAEMAKLGQKKDIKKRLIALLKGNGTALDQNRLEIEKYQGHDKKPEK